MGIQTAMGLENSIKDVCALLKKKSKTAYNAIKKPLKGVYNAIKKRKIKALLKRFKDDSKRLKVLDDRHHESCTRYNTRQHNMCGREKTHERQKEDMAHAMLSLQQI